MSAGTLAADVIIVTWNGRGRLDSCLEQLARQTAPQRVIVVDNASTDGTPAMVRERHPGVDVIEMDRNVGFGRAVNAGAAAGQGEAIVLVNDDVEVDETCLEAIVAPLAHDPSVGMVAGLTTIPATDLVDSFGIELDVTLAAYNRLRRRPAAQAPGVLLGPSGGLASYRRRAFDEVGGFDDRLFAYGEDVDLALRLRLAGWEAAAAPAARGVHLGAATVGADSARQRFLAGFARAFLLRRFGVLRGRHAPRAILIEALVVASGFIRGRTAAHVRGRIAGWRAAAGDRLDVPAGAVDAGIDVREALRRLVRAR
jgi:N-acetylglucosaminyl-diphospho-decaprenol L-rhamnosyltransferase